ncbi:SAM-dependent methyltransferase [Arthrobacter sp. 9AX]|uniref:bifunctional PIG-L family deacetylase/class I SAM-dependent methyltransferase n=1 Tax=Arthrobacter sp. 9AX TaxID=2653131 RepID=UPI0012F12A9E|nr:bifunctional PIG-L family deacetylase/class I SAM-dependent methyltransferase [Arthrobacter sp. 9AX]VXB94108.1 SAM-dependent methyltransferase [Arthrobacter sp. 9AX]
MVTFAHTDAGTDESDWAASGLPVIAELPLSDQELAAMKFLVLAAHPDDESLGAGGLLARLHSVGAEVSVLLCTAGEASHPASRTISREDLAATRLGEFAAGMECLGLKDCWQYLHLPDGGLQEHAADLRRRVQEAAGRLGGQPGRVAIVAPYRADGHTDHEALGAVAADVATSGGHALMEYPIWYWLWATPDHPAWRDWNRVGLEPREQLAKERAMRAHISQTRPLSPHAGDEVLLDEPFLRHFSRPFETFAWTGPGVFPGKRDDPEAGVPHTSGQAEQIFDGVHAREPDPWQYTTSWYERRKRALTLAALPADKYAAGLEIGCSIGELSADLAAQCTNLLAVDASSTALQRAAQRLAPFPGVALRQLTLPGSWPGGNYDLVVLSEVGYYFAPRELDELLDNIADSILPGGTLLLCHWRHPISGWELDGETVHTIARSRLKWRTHGLYRERDFLLETLIAPAQQAEAPQ